MTPVVCRMLSSRSILPHSSLEASVSFAQNDPYDHLEGSFSVLQPVLHSSCFTSLIKPSIHLKVLYTLKKSAQKEEAVVRSSTGPDLDRDRMGNICCSNRAQSSVLLPFCSRFDSDVKDDSSEESKLTLPKEISSGGRGVQDPIVTSSIRSSNASEPDRTDRLFSSEPAESSMGPRFAQDSSLSRGRQGFGFGNRVRAFAAADSREMVRFPRAALPVWANCSAASSRNSTAFHSSTRSVESSKDHSADSVISTNGFLSEEGLHRQVLNLLSKQQF